MRRTFVVLAVLSLLSALAGDTNAQSFTTLLSFSGTNGMWPMGSLTLSGFTLFGMTQIITDSGVAKDGNIFSINTDGGNFQNLLLFDGANGDQPTGNLTLSGSTPLYGMTQGNSGVYKASTATFSVSTPMAATSKMCFGLTSQAVQLTDFRLVV